MTIAAINKLQEDEKRALYSRFIPPALLDRFSWPAADEGLERWLSARR